MQLGAKVLLGGATDIVRGAFGAEFRTRRIASCASTRRYAKRTSRVATGLRTVQIATLSD